MKAINKKHYDLFCLAWRKYAKRNFPNGFPITMANLTKVYKKAQSSDDFGAAIRTVLTVCSPSDVDYKWLNDFTWYTQTDNSIIKLAYKVLTTEKLTRQMMKDCGICK